jgi:hypothetical protein
VDPRAGLDDVEKRQFLTLPGLELQPLGHPACSQSLYRLRYPGSLPIIYNNIIIFTLFPVCSRNSYTAVLRLAFYYVKNVQVIDWDSSGPTKHKKTPHLNIIFPYTVNGWLRQMFVFHICNLMFTVRVMRITI